MVRCSIFGTDIPPVARLMAAEQGDKVDAKFFDTGRTNNSSERKQRLKWVVGHEFLLGGEFEGW